MPLTPEEADRLATLVAVARLAENKEGQAIGAGRKKRAAYLREVTNARCFTMYEYIRSITK